MDNKWIVLSMIIIFSLGWLSSLTYTDTFLEKPEIIVKHSNGSVSSSADIFNPEKPSPYDRIKEDQIHVYPDKVLLDIKNVQWAKFTDTNSMDPVIDEGSNALQIIPKTEAEIYVGDIISYDSDYSYGIVIHRVVRIGDDGEWYAIAKGDNNPAIDPGKIRFDQIKKVVIGIIY